MPRSRAARVGKYDDVVPSGNPARCSTLRCVRPRPPSSDSTSIAASQSSRRRSSAFGLRFVSMAEVYPPGCATIRALRRSGQRRPFIDDHDLLTPADDPAFHDGRARGRRPEYRRADKSSSIGREGISDQGDRPVIIRPTPSAHAIMCTLEGRPAMPWRVGSNMTPAQRPPGPTGHLHARDCPEFTALQKHSSTIAREFSALFATAETAQRIADSLRWWVPNWPSDLDAERAWAITGDGIPLAYVPGPEVVAALVDADSQRQRLQVLAQSRSEILANCRGALEPEWDAPFPESIEMLPPLVVEAIDVLEAGYPQPHAHLGFQ